MSIKIFLSTVSNEFRAYRDFLRHELTRQNVEVKVQEDFVDLGGDTLDKLDVYIAECDAVVHLIGDMTGATPGAREQAALLRKLPDIISDLPPLADALSAGAPITYTQWEAWLALHRKKLLLIATPGKKARREKKTFAPTDASRAAQRTHLDRLNAVRRFSGCAFANADQLATYVFRSGILDLLVEDYAASEAHKRKIAQGFIREIAPKIAANKNHDFDGMKQEVRTAIEIYEKEIAGGVVETNIDSTVDAALQKAKTQLDKGQSGLARATLRRAAEEMRCEEQERRDQYEQGVRLLYTREKDIALAAYDGEAAAQAVIEMTEALHGDNHERLWEELKQAENALLVFGRDQGSNVHLVADIAVARHLEQCARTPDEKGYARNAHGIALGALGERESGTARLEEAVAAFRAALEEWTRERVPLDWAATQTNLGTALSSLGGRESGTARLEKAVAAYRAALEAISRERVPLQWAMTQNNLGTALSRLGERESGNARLQEAVAAYRAALEEFSRQGGPLAWATTQTNLGTALQMLGERESGTARLEEAVAAFRAALEECTRERVPLDWAMTRNNLGNALLRLGERESGTARLEEAVAAYRAALEERTRERVPLNWAMTRNNLGNALLRLGERESGTARLEEAVAAYRAALEEFPLERVPLNWANTTGNQGYAMLVLAERTSDGALASHAMEQLETAESVLREGGHEAWSITFRNQIPAAKALVERLAAPTK
ncbi:tetratricopeptide (TPR) repeat protein [Rhodoblastus acidophilus]|uniref:tetratricopeptide repeat protein n=1 Tax=Rhodoblastus acidophilus TaxID=1074 RepID=UPI002224EAF7|nr:tetratricopeptide repeat protein [Rhodoblastus acidophilus]MCW2282879.1 tetratricopeptide (TPR) repeat protein [Rhodoblastus acidophilus]MCW2331740.1 tetratricopeptide (TPR) repeat protein [Rhodoblastus acidophilus]